VFEPGGVDLTGDGPSEEHAALGSAAVAFVVLDGFEANAEAFC